MNTECDHQLEYLYPKSSLSLCGSFGALQVMGVIIKNPGLLAECLNSEVYKKINYFQHVIFPWHLLWYA